MVLQQVNYRSTERREWGQHYKINPSRTTTPVTKQFTPTDKELISDLLFITARFGRSMDGFAAKNGVRYQFTGTNDEDTELGRSDATLMSLSA